VKPPKTNPKKKAVAQTVLTAKEGRQFLLLEIKAQGGPKTGKPVARCRGLERTFWRINSPALRLPAGQPGARERAG